MEVIIKIKIDEPVQKSTEESKETISYSQYARFFDESCPNWCKNSEYNLAFLRMQQLNATELLRTHGYLFLNDVYHMLGIPRTKAGQVVGWIYDPDGTGDNYVDFGLYDEKNRQFINGCKENVLIDFNVDGIILDKI